MVDFSYSINAISISRILFFVCKPADRNGYFDAERQDKGPIAEVWCIDHDDDGCQLEKKFSV